MDDWQIEGLEATSIVQEKGADDTDRDPEVTLRDKYGYPDGQVWLP